MKTGKKIGKVGTNTHAHEVYLPRIADKETVNHIYIKVNNWLCLHSYKPKPVTGRLTKEITDIPLRHFVWNISERFDAKNTTTRTIVPTSSEFSSNGSLPARI